MTSAQTQTPLPVIASPEQQPNDDRLYMPHLSSFKACCFLMGLLVGFFIYLSTLGAEFLAVMMWGRDILLKTNSELIWFSLGWNFLTTCLALLVLGALRRIVMAVAHPTLRTNPRHAPVVEDIVDELIWYLEGRFAVGALVGICLSWNVTNFVLGMRPQIIQSCAILAAACLWCRLTLLLLGGSGNGMIYDTMEDIQEEQPSKDKDDKTEPLLQVL